MTRIVEGENINEDFNELSLRPETLREYIGQNDIKENLKIFIEAAKLRSETLDHTILYGPPGLGKTTLANIIANELEVNIKTVSGPSIEKPGELAAILTQLEVGDVLFIDEIHRLPKIVEEILYSAMEDFYIDIVVGKDSSTKSITINLEPFTLIGATTRVGDLSNPLRDRFGIDCRLEYYTLEQLSQIAIRTADVLEVEFQKDAATDLALRSRGTPRICNRLLKRIRDFAQVENSNIIDLSITKKSLDRLKIDALGLDHIDHKILLGIIERFNGGPVGLDALCSSIGEEKITIEEVYEPYLLQLNLISRTPRGRIATEKAYNHLNMADLFNGEKQTKLL